MRGCEFPACCLGGVQEGIKPSLLHAPMPCMLSLPDSGKIVFFICHILVGVAIPPVHLKVDPEQVRGTKWGRQQTRPVCCCVPRRA